MNNLFLLKKKLAGYSAITGAMLAANHNADAQIIYHDINPDVQLDSVNNSYLLDMDNDGVFDFKFNYLQTYLGVGASSYGKILPYNANEVMAYLDNPGFVAVFFTDEIISANPPYLSYQWLNNQVPVFTYDLAHYGEMGWVNVIDKFAAIILKQADGNHYGWIRMTHSYTGFSPTPLIIEDFAYQSQPDSSILAGEIYPASINHDAPFEFFNAFVENTQLIIRFNQAPLPSHFILSNAVGMKLSEQAIAQNELVMDVSDLAAGVYFVEVNDGEKRKVKKVLIY